MYNVISYIYFFSSRRKCHDFLATLHQYLVTGSKLYSNVPLWPQGAAVFTFALMMSFWYKHFNCSLFKIHCSRYSCSSTYSHFHLIMILCALYWHSLL